MSGDGSKLATPRLTLGNGTTNPKFDSHVELPAEPRHTVTLQFAPACQHLSAKERGRLSARDSLDLKGNLVAVQAQKTPLLKYPTVTTLTGLSIAKHYKLKNGERSLLSFKANSFNIYNVHDADLLRFFFSRDAIAKYRAVPLWEMAIKCRTYLTIFEKPGHLGHDPESVLDYYDADFDIAWFSAVLSGDTWKECSPAFSEAEAVSIMNGSKVAPEIVSAVSKVYGPDLTPERNKAGETGRKFVEGVLAAGKAPMRFIWPKDTGNQNPANNISNFNDLTDIPRRVHPLAYAAVFKAAAECDLQSVEFNSSWRPMLGSCAHRQGRGLDVGQIVRAGEKPLKVQFVYSDMTAEQQAAYDAVIREDGAKARLKEAKEESGLLGKAEEAYAAAIGKSDKLDADIEAADKAMKKTEEQLSAAPTAKARLDYKKAKTKVSDLQDKRKLLDNDLQKKKAAYESAWSAKNAIPYFEYFLEDAQKNRKKAEEDWDKVLTATERPLLTAFRAALVRNKDVIQVLDPWRMDINTQDKASQTGQDAPHNYRHPGLDQIHDDHMHITCVYRELTESVDDSD